MAKADPRRHGVLARTDRANVEGFLRWPGFPGVPAGVLRSERAFHEYRCECGRFYYVAFAATVEECPRCHRPMRVAGTGEGTPAPP